MIGANTVNKDYYERLLKEKNENGIGLHEVILRRKRADKMAINKTIIRKLDRRIQILN